jgi:hypothetical protein
MGSKINQGSGFAVIPLNNNGHAALLVFDLAAVASQRQAA